MSSSSHLGSTNNPSKVYHLDEAQNEADVTMRPNNFIQSSKSRKAINSKSDAILVDYKQGTTVTEYDLSETQSGHSLSIDKNIKAYKFSNLKTAPLAFETENDLCGWLVAMLAESPLALSLLRHAEENNWVIELCGLDNGEYHLETEQKILGLNHHGFDAHALGNSEFFLSSVLFTTMKALRDIWHESKLENVETTYKPDSAIMIERACTADIDAISIIIGWELRSAGHNHIWRHILSTDDSDMAQVLINILDRYPTALYNGMAHAHVFRQWYASYNRIDSLDHVILEELDHMLGEDSINFGTETATAGDFEKLSTLPDKTVYLNGLGETVARDPFFSGLNSPINQAHLFQIIYDSKVTEVEGVPFRDTKLAQKIFPVS